MEESKQSRAGGAIRQQRSTTHTKLTLAFHSSQQILRILSHTIWPKWWAKCCVLIQPTDIKLRASVCKTHSTLFSNAIQGQQRFIDLSLLSDQLLSSCRLPRSWLAITLWLDGWERSWSVSHTLAHLLVFWHISVTPLCLKQLKQKRKEKKTLTVGTEYFHPHTQDCSESSHALSISHSQSVSAVKNEGH